MNLDQSQRPLPDKSPTSTKDGQNFDSNFRSGQVADIRELVDLVISSKTSNRNNAKEHTGKRTPRGKLHAIECGPLSTRRLIEGEDQKVYRRLTARLMAELMPKTAVEVMLVDQMVGDLWRLRRVEGAERAYFEQIRSAAVVRVLRNLSANELGLVPEFVNRKSLPVIDGVKAISASVSRKLDAAVDPDKLMLDGVVSSEGAFPYSCLEQIRRSLVRDIMHKNAHLVRRQNHRLEIRNKPPSTDGDVS